MRGLYTPFLFWVTISVGGCAFDTTSSVGQEIIAQLLFFFEIL